MELIIGCVLGLVVGCACVLIYRKGVADGMGMTQGEKPMPISVPLFDEIVKKSAKPNEFDEQYQNFVNYQPKFTEDSDGE